MKMECICMEQYQDVRPGTIFTVTEIHEDYYILESTVGWKIEVNNKYFDKCFKNII